MNVKKTKDIKTSKKSFKSNNDLLWEENDGDLAVTTTLSMPKKSGKKFFSDLDAFFESAMDDLWKEDKQVSSNKSESESDISKPTKNHTRSGKKSFFSGLDALFSPTSGAIQETEMDEAQYKENLKRVTFLFKKDKLEVLKGMAKKEKLYLRDIISKVLDQYLEEKGIPTKGKS